MIAADYVGSRTNNVSEAEVAMLKSATAIRAGEQEIETCKQLVLEYRSFIHQFDDLPAEIREGVSLLDLPKTGGKRHRIRLTSEWQDGADLLWSEAANLRYEDPALEQLRLQLLDDIQVLHTEMETLAKQLEEVFRTGRPQPRGLSPIFQERLDLMPGRELLITTTLGRHIDELNSLIRQYNVQSSQFEAASHAATVAWAYAGGFVGAALGWFARRLRRSWRLGARLRARAPAPAGS